MASELAIVNQSQPAGMRISIQPSTLSEAKELAVDLAKSTIVPKEYQGNPANVMATVLFGSEIGLPAMQSLESIANINGRRSVWGDSMLAIVMNHPAYEGHDEGVEGEGDARVGWFTIKRKGHQPYTVRFSKTEAVTAKLWTKEGPWTNYPNRMLRLRARSWALRDKFPDALKGLIAREEAMDIDAIDNTGHTVIDAHLDSAAQAAQAEQKPAQQQQQQQRAQTDSPFISAEQRREFYNAWQKSGHTGDSVKKWLIDTFMIDDSRKIPAKEWDKAKTFAETAPAPSDRDKVIKAMGLLSYPQQRQDMMLKEYADRLPALLEALNAELDAGAQS